MPNLLQKAVSALLDLGAKPADSSEQRTIKRISIALTATSVLPLFGEGLQLYLLNEPQAGILFMFWSVLMLALLVLLGSGRMGFEPLLIVALFSIVVLSFTIMLSLGGLLRSNGQMVWIILAPVGALIANRPRLAMFLTGIAVCELLAGAFLAPQLRESTNVPPQVAAITQATNIVFAMFFVIGGIGYALNQRDRAHRLLLREEEKSERLLLNILPRDIAARLKDNRVTIAEYCPTVSVLFADMVGFTPLTAELAPAEMVDMLDDIFSRFDLLVEKYGLEKIRTIGDNYMVASGVPRPRSDHAQALVQMALDMHACIRDLSPRVGENIKFRIGINSGPLIAGVIGHMKFQYDLWGDTVNIASRMESQGEPGKIQVTRDTYELIKDEFVCEPRGKVEVKGKGDLQTWFVVGRQVARPALGEQLGPREALGAVHGSPEGTKTL